MTTAVPIYPASSSSKSLPYSAQQESNTPRKPDSSTINLGSALLDDFAYSSNVASCAVYVRLGFLRKVYALLSTQLIATILIAGAMMWHSDSMKVWLKGNTWVLLLFLILSIGLIFGLHVKARDTPTNYYLFFGFVSKPLLFILHLSEMVFIHF